MYGTTHQMCYNVLMIKKGDTLIEVTLAIGIFSMVAIAVVSVMVSGTSNAQTALETTLTREEIDAQAEAIRFIHSAYISEKTLPEDERFYTSVWEEITNENKVSSNSIDLKFSPRSCQEIYDRDNPGAIQKGFVINPRALSLTKNSDGPADVTLLDKVFIPYDLANPDNNIFQPTTTYPRIIYDNSNNLVEDTTRDSTVRRVEGLYVLAVKDAGSTTIIDKENTFKPTGAYYDFYIRSCWYGTGSETPSTISTVIRLYDPEAIQN